MKNSTIVRELKKRNQLHEEVKALKRQIAKLQQKVWRAELKIETLDSVTEVFHGVALHVTPGLFGYVEAVDSDVTLRGARVTEKQDGKHLVSLFREKDNRECVATVEMFPKDVALDIAKRWVVFEEVPT